MLIYVNILKIYIFMNVIYDWIYWMLMIALALGWMLIVQIAVNSCLLLTKYIT